MPKRFSLRSTDRYSSGAKEFLAARLRIRKEEATGISAKAYVLGSELREANCALLER